MSAGDAEQQPADGGHLRSPDRGRSLRREEAHPRALLPLGRKQPFKVEAELASTDLELPSPRRLAVISAIALTDQGDEARHEVIRDRVVRQVAGSAGQTEMEVAAQQVAGNSQ